MMIIIIIIIIILLHSWVSGAHDLCSRVKNSSLKSDRAWNEWEFLWFSSDHLAKTEETQVFNYGFVGTSFLIYYFIITSSFDTMYSVLLNASSNNPRLNKIWKHMDFYQPLSNISPNVFSPVIIVPVSRNGFTSFIHSPVLKCSTWHQTRLIALSRAPRIQVYKKQKPRICATNVIF